MRGEGSKLGSLLLIPDHVSQVTRLVGQCESASRGASVQIKVRSVRIELHKINSYFCNFAKLLSD